MGTNAERLIAMLRERDPFAHPAAEIRALQLAAVNERVEERAAQIPALGHRRSELGIGRLDSLGDIVPMLFTYRTYRSYPDVLLQRQNWTAMTRWLQSLSAVSPQRAPDLQGIVDVDDWLARLQAVGHHVQVNPGADGKPAFLSQSPGDYARRNVIPMIEWATGIEASPTRLVVLLVPRQGYAVYIRSFTQIGEAYGRPGAIHFLTDGAARVTDVIRMHTVAEQLAGTEATRAAAQTRPAATGERFDELARLLLAHRGEKVVIIGLADQHFALVDALERLGAPDGLFDPHSLIGPAIGKAQRLPAEQIARVYRRYGVDPRSAWHLYSMSEVTGQMPMCASGRYHVPPWQPIIMVDREGEKPLVAEGVVEGRVALFDLLLEGRWGGFLTSDKATVDFGSCACGRPGPTVLDSISRYTDIDDDKLSCAGSINSYIRGAIR